MILLDIGHGFDTPGKRTPAHANGMYINEWQINLCFAMATHRRLIANGTAAQFVSRDFNDTPLKKRADYINSFGNRAKACISFHANAGVVQGFSDANGFELLHGNAAKPGKYAAELLGFIEPALKKHSIRNRGTKVRNDLYLLNRTMPTTLLLEVGFMTNTQDLEIICNPHYQDAIACAVAQWATLL